MIKLKNQFEAVESPTPFARSEEGNTSEGKAQGTGPHEAPKASMKNNNIDTEAQPSALCAGQLLENFPTNTLMMR